MGVLPEGHVMLSLKSPAAPNRRPRLVIEWAADLSQAASNPRRQE
jgi:hypothetical protein